MSKKQLEPSDHPPGYWKVMFILFVLGVILYGIVYIVTWGGGF
jgi:hypothetical protein